MVIGLVLAIVFLGIIFVLAGMGALYALIGIIIGGVLIGFGVHFVPVGGAPAAMGQAPGIATGVAMLAAGAGLAGLFGGAWAAEQGTRRRNRHRRYRRRSDDGDHLSDGQRDLRLRHGHPRRLGQGHQGPDHRRHPGRVQEPGH